MKDFQQHDCSEPNSLVCRFEHYKVEHSGVDVIFPLYTETEVLTDTLTSLHANGWILKEQFKTFIIYPDDDADDDPDGSSA